MKIPYYVILPSYFAYALGFIFGHLRDFVSFFRNHVDKPPKGYAPLCRDFEDFYTRRMYRRIQDCFNRPIASAPNTWIDVIERVSHDNVTLVRTKNTRRCINLGSYNYLGFAAQDEYCTPRVIECLEKFGASACASRVECGTSVLHEELERVIAKFVGKPAAMVYGMGYATNSTTLPALIGKDIGYYTYDDSMT